MDEVCHGNRPVLDIFIRYVVTRRMKDAVIAATEPEGASEMTSFGMVQSSSPETAHHRSFWVETEVRMKS